MSAIQLLALFRKCGGDHDAFITAIEKHGFKFLDQGFYKAAYSDGKLVAKVPALGQTAESMRVEHLAWKRASRALRKYLLPILVYDEAGLIVQNKVEPSGWCHCPEAKRAASYLKLRDFPANHFHSTYNGKRIAVFYDFGLAFKLHRDLRFT